MTLGDLLAYTRQYMLRDTAAPVLWTDDELVRHLNDAQRQFARHTHCLVSDSETFCAVTTADGTARYPLDAKIIYILEILHDDTGTPVRHSGRSRLPHGAISGRPTLYTADAAYKGLRLYPAPDGVYALTLLVAHLPTKTMSQKAHSPEIPEEYHTLLCDYAVFRALMNNDPEGSATATAREFELRWKLGLRDAKRDAYHMRASPNAAVVNNWTGGRR